MLDILTVVTLERMVWQDTGWAVETFGAEGAEVLRKAQVDAENDAWGCAAEVLPRERLREVRQVIVDWQHAHPNNRYVSTMRFDDFAADGGDLARRAALAAHAANGGFLAPINEATRAVDQTRMWGERFLFITGRLQRMLSWQAELLTYELAAMPEVKEVMADHRLMAEATQRFSAAVAAWPEVLARERAGWVRDFCGQTGAIGGIVTQIREAFAEAGPVAADVRDTAQSAALVAADLRAAVREAGPVVSEIARLSGKGPAVTPAGAAPAAPATAPAAAPGPMVASAVVPAAAGPVVVAPTASSPPAAAVAAPVAAAIASSPAAVPPVAAGRPFDIQEYERVVHELRGLVDATDTLLESRYWQTRLNEVNSAAETRVAHAGREGRELINYGFFRGIFFAIFCAALLFVTGLLYRFTVRRLFPPQPHAAAAPTPRASADGHALHR
jgi:hypothetical protein